MSHTSKTLETKFGLGVEEQFMIIQSVFITSSKSVQVEWNEMEEIFWTLRK